MSRFWQGVILPLMAISPRGAIITLGDGHDQTLDGFMAVAAASGVRLELLPTVQQPDAVDANANVPALPAGSRTAWLLAGDPGDGRDILARLIENGAGRGADGSALELFVLLGLDSIIQHGNSRGIGARWPHHGLVEIPAFGGFSVMYSRALARSNPGFDAWLRSVRGAHALWPILEALDRERGEREREVRDLRQGHTLHGRLPEFTDYILRRIARDAAALRRYRPWRLASRIARVVNRLRREAPRPGPLDDIEEMARAGLRQLDATDRQPARQDSGQEPPVASTWLAPAAVGSSAGSGHSASIIVLNRNGAARLEALFGTFQRTHRDPLEFEFLVVDHGSGDRSREVIDRYRDSLRIRPLFLDANDTFARSNNRAAGMARFDHLVFLNNDIVFLEQTVPRLLGELVADPRVGVVAPVLVYPPMEGQPTDRIQHAGIRFREDVEAGFMRPFNLQELPDGAAERCEVPAVTGALMACRRSEFERIGGFCESYVYGYEDVDFCLSLRRDLGKVALVVTNLKAVHDESATQKRDRRREVVRRRLGNIEVLRQRFGYPIRRHVRLDQATGARFWTAEKLNVALMVAEDGTAALAGGRCTARELAAALETELGWAVRLVPRSAGDAVWYDLDGIDVMIAMVDDYDLGRVRNPLPALVRLAWIENWPDSWASQSRLGAFDALVCASHLAADHVRAVSGEPVHVTGSPMDTAESGEPGPAMQVASVLQRFRDERYRIAIKVPAPSWRHVDEWGDYHFAACLARALRRLGHAARIDLYPDWYDRRRSGDDVVLVLRGLRQYHPDGDHINLLWNVSHPDKILFEEYEGYDHVFVASVRYARFLESHLNVPVAVLLQCTDPDRFRPTMETATPWHDVLFVGNSRGMLRPIVRDAIAADLPVGVYGRDWEGLIPPSRLIGTRISNDELGQHYSNARVVLNDHWDDMREEGFISNRIFDALACGANLVSDPAEGLAELFGDHVHTYTGGSEALKTLVARLAAPTPDERRARRALIMDHHTFDARAREIVATVSVIDARKRLPNGPSERRESLPMT